MQLDMAYKLHRWLWMWVDLICSLIGVITLGCYRPWWDFAVRSSYLERQAKKAENK